MKPPSQDPIQHNISIRLLNAPSVSAEQPIKILLLKLDHIGDFITALDAFRIIRQAFNKAEITLICLPSVKSLAQRTGLFDKISSFALVPESNQWGKVPDVDPKNRIERFKALLDGPYFLAADFKHDPYDRFGLDHVEADYTAGFKCEAEKGLDIVIPTMEWDVPALSVHDGKNLPIHAELRLTLLAHAIVGSLLEKQRLSEKFSASDEDIQNESYKALKDDHRLKIGLCMGAGSELRQWQADYWFTLATTLIEKHKAHLVFFGGEADKAETHALSSKLPSDCLTDLTGRIPLASVPTYMSLLDAYIGCDTGLTHLAATIGLPTVNIFSGVSSVSVWRARGPKVKTVYTEVICSPCHLRFKEECPNNNICMKVISPNIVYSCFEQLFAPNGLSNKA